MLAVAIVGILALVGVPAYSEHVEKARVAQAVADLLVMNSQLQRHNNDYYAYPEDLSAIGATGKLDPWGRPYRYLNLQIGNNRAQARKNRNLVPINSDFDLYSDGRDGASSPPLTARRSQDDVVRANDGQFHGLASTYR
jgi:general secretion pathway protein G